MQQEEATLETARYDLSKVRIESPIKGIVTRRNIEEGEMVVIGTMNNAGTVLLTIADMSVIEAEVEVDETDIPESQARPDREDHDRRDPRQDVHRQGDRDRQQPDSDDGRSGGAGDELQGRGHAGHRDSRSTARIHLHGRNHDRDAERRARHSDPGDDGPRDGRRRQRRIVREPVTDGKRPRPSGGVQAAELKPGQCRKELEGVFLVRDGKAVFTPIKTGIAGDKYFESLSGVKEADSVIIGPFSSVRELTDGAAVKVEQPATRRPGAAS